MTPREISTFFFRRYYEDSETVFTNLDSKRKIGPAFVVDDALASRLDKTEFKDWSRWAPAGRYEIKSIYIQGLHDKIKNTNGRFMIGLFVILNKYNFRTCGLVFNSRIEAIVHSNSPKAEGMGKLNLETLECTFDETWTRAIDAWPQFGFTLWSCTSNEWYGMKKILHEYIGLRTDISLLGKIQHTWQPDGCTGIDCEQGYQEEVKLSKSPVYIWSSSRLEEAKEYGLNAFVIGAPWIYMKDVCQTNKTEKSLLAFPTHSFSRDFMVANISWSSYADELNTTARKYGFEKVSVCLHESDFNENTMSVLENSGINVVTGGSPKSDQFLFNIRTLIRQHSATTSERMCTSGLYSLYEDVPFFISGTAFPLIPEGRGVVTADRNWIEERFPKLLTYTGNVYKEYALKELGFYDKKDPSELREILYGWAGL